MAKSKNKKLTIEDALVPVEEQPYEVPGNWCWTYLNNIAQWGSGGTPSRKHPEYYGGSIPWIKTGELEDDYLYDSEERITEEAVANSSAKIFPKNSVLIAMYGATIGKTAILAIPATTNQACACARCYDFINNKYLFYYLRSQKDAFIRKGKGGAQPNISQDIIKNHSVPLPPFAEQQRIVEHIESLFFKLDEAKDRIQTTIDNSEDRRNAIFSKAFSGELTSEWRKQREISLDTWQDVISQDVCEPITCGKTPKEFISSEGEIPYLKVYNIVENKIDFVTTPQFIPREIHEGKLKSSRLKPHDVIMNIVGPPLRKVAIIPDDYADWNMNQAIVRFRPIPELMDYKYLYYELLNPETLDDVIAQTRGVVGQANISVTQSRNLRFKCPTVDEQKEVVRILEGLLEREAEILKISINVIDEISALKKAILAKAFRGELGTNNVEEESAELYLKKILS